MLGVAKITTCMSVSAHAVCVWRTCQYECVCVCVSCVSCGIRVVLLLTVIPI